MQKVHFNKAEKIGILVTSLIIAFILSFRSWGVDTFDAPTGFSNLIIAFICVLISLYTKFRVEKKVGNSVGYDTAFTPWYVGLGIGALLAFVSNGVIVFLAVGAGAYTAMYHARIGHYHYYSHRTMARLAILGILTNLVLAMLAKVAFAWTSLLFFHTFMKINIWLAIYGLVPVPMILQMKFPLSKINILPSEGLFILYSSRVHYVLALALVVLSSLSMTFLPLMWSVVSSLLLMAMVGFWYYFAIEQGLRK